MASIGEKIELARVRMGMDQKDLAQALGVSKATVSRWESGETEPRPWRLAKIAKELKKPVEWFKGGVDEGEILRRLEALEAKLPAKSDTDRAVSVADVVSQIEALAASKTVSRVQAQIAKAFLTGDSAYLEGVSEPRRRQLLALLESP